jgi:hypothetical protein
MMKTLLPESNDGLNKLKNMTAAYWQALMNVPSLTITRGGCITFPHQTDFADYTTPIAIRNAPEGFAEVLAERLVPRTLF